MSIYRCVKSMVGTLLCAAFIVPVWAQESANPKKNSDEAKKPSEAEMIAMMMEMAKPGPNHKQMQDLVGTWSYAVKWWMNPEAPPSESSGVTVTKSIMGGRYLVSDHTGKMQMPGADGKMAEMEFKGMAIEGYDNARKKYVASWIDNMGTGIMNLEGAYDPSTKTLTYYADYEAMPGMKTRIRETVTAPDKDHHTLQFFEDRGGKEVKTMQIDYTRKS